MLCRKRHELHVLVQPGTARVYAAVEDDDVPLGEGGEAGPGGAYVGCVEGGELAFIAVGGKDEEVRAGEGEFVYGEEVSAVVDGA